MITFEIGVDAVDEPAVGIAVGMRMGCVVGLGVGRFDGVMVGSLVGALVRGRTRIDLTPPPQTQQAVFAVCPARECWLPNGLQAECFS